MKNEDALKRARNEIANHKEQLKFPYKNSSSACLGLDNSQENGQRHHVVPKAVLEKEQEQQSLN